MTSEETALQMALPLFNTKITSLKCNHCNGSGYKKSRSDGYMHVATSLQRISLKAEEDKQYAAAVGAQKMIYELLLRRKMDHEAAKASRPGWGYRHGNTRS